MKGRSEYILNALAIIPELLKEAVDGLASEVKALEASIKKLESGISEINSKLDRHGDFLVELREGYASLNRRLSHVELTIGGQPRPSSQGW